MSENDTDEPIARAAYEALAETFDRLVDTKPHNAYYERPATLALLPDLVGLRVLDAGCGPGAYAERLLDAGARVVGVDVSPQMIERARGRVGDRAELHCADLSGGLPFLADESVDGVLSPLALDYIEKWEPVFREFHRVLVPTGWFVFSVSHPFFDAGYYETNAYFETELVGCEWKGFGVRVFVPAYRRPLSAVFAPLAAAGFVVEAVVEPLPTEEFRRAAPEDYEKLASRPGFLCVRARKS